MLMALMISLRLLSSIPVVLLAQWHPVFIAAHQEACASPLLALLELVVACLGHGLQVAAIPEQLEITAMRYLVIDHHLLLSDALAVVMWTLAEWMPA